MTAEYLDMHQYSDAWWQARIGIPTASEFAKVSAKTGPRGGTSSKEYVGRLKYLRTLAAERITGEPQEPEWAGNRHTERGAALEDEARALYALLRDAEPKQVGFIRNGNCGASPDAVVGESGLLEIKSALGHIQIQRLLDGVLPPEHRAQVYGQLMVSERDWLDFMSYSPGLPPFIVRVERDEAYIGELRAAVDQFCAELDELVKRIQEM